MAKYIFADIIIDPKDPRLKGAIGKECYFSDYPKAALDYARNHSTEYRLKRIEKEVDSPFIDEDGNNWTCIIIKKEQPKPNYEPFETLGEFLCAYYYVEERLGSLRPLACRGIWLKQKEPEAYVMITELWSVGVVIGDNKFIIDKESICNNTTDWGELLKDFTFLDDSECGKPMEDK